MKEEKFVYNKYINFRYVFSNQNLHFQVGGIDALFIDISINKYNLLI